MVVVGPRLLAADGFVVDRRRSVAALDDASEAVVGVGGANAIDVVERMNKATMHDGTNVMVAPWAFLLRAASDYDIPR